MAVDDLSFLPDQPGEDLSWLPDQAGGSRLGVRPTRLTMTTDPVRTIARSGQEYIGGIFDAVAHPIRTGKALFDLGAAATPVGVIDRIRPGVQPSEAAVSGVSDFLRTRYGGIEAIKETLNTDPVGALADLSAALSGSGALVSGAGRAGSIGRAIRTGRMLSAAGEAIDPLSATMRAAGSGVKALAAGKTLRAPFAGKVNPEVIKAEKALGVDLPASAKVSGKVVPIAEALTLKGPFGKQLADKLEAARQRLTAVADRVVSAGGKSGDLSAAGNAIVRGADQFQDIFIRTKNEMYERAGIFKKGREIAFFPKRSLEFIKSVLEQKRSAAKLIGSAPDTDFYANLADRLSKRYGVTAADVRSAILELNEKTKNYNDPFVTGNRGKLKKLTAYLSEELDEAITAQRKDLAEDIRKANAYYSNGVELLNSRYGEAIFALRDQPDKIVPAILNKGTSVDDIPRIFELIGKKAVPDVRAAFLEQFFQGAKNTDSVFTPYGISRQIFRYGEDKLRAILTPQQFEALKNLETATKSLAGIEKVASGSQTGFIGRIAGELAALFAGNPVPLAVDAAFSKFIASKMGQRFLSTGIKLNGKRIDRGIKRTSQAVGTAGRTARVGEIVDDQRR